MKKNLKVCLLIGLILSTILYAYLAISVFIGIFASTSIINNANSIGEAFVAPAIAATIALMVIILIFALIALIFTAICFKKISMPPSEFDQAKKLLITVIIFNIIFSIFFLYGIIQSGPDTITIIALIGIIISTVLIIIDIVKNKKLLKLQKNDNLSTENNNANLTQQENDLNKWN